MVVIDTGDYTLQAGANTFNLNTGGAVGIKLASNPATDIAAHAAGSMIALVYNQGSTVWQLLGA